MAALYYKDPVTGEEKPLVVFEIKNKVRSVFGRTGDVIAQKNDYTAEMVGADPEGAAAAVQGNLDAHAENQNIHVTAEKQAAWTAGSSDPNQRIYSLAATKSGTVFTLSGAPSLGQFTGKFNAPAAFAEGDTFQIGNTDYTATLANGESLPDGVFTAGAKGILVEADTAAHTLGFKSGGGANGNLPPLPANVWAKGGNGEVALGWDDIPASYAALWDYVFVNCKASGYSTGPNDYDKQVRYYQDGTVRIVTKGAG